VTATARDNRAEIQGAALAGLVGAVLAAAGMLAVGLVLDQPTIAETVADGIARVTPLETIERMTATFGENAKHLLFVSVLLGEIGLGVVLGVIYSRQRWPTFISVCALAALVAIIGLIVLPALSEGVLGIDSAAGLGATLVSLLTTAGLFAVGFRAAGRALHPAGIFAEEESASRRAFLTKSILGVAGVVVGIAAVQWLAERLTPSPSGEVSRGVAATNGALAGAGDLVDAITSGVPGLSPEITPNDRFYVVSKNLIRDPTVNEQSWRLEVSGAVDRPVTLTYDDLKALPDASQYFTLQCISNEVGGSLIGNALWRGIPLANLLRLVGARAGAVDVILRAADDYADSIPIGKALEPAAMLAYEMNGELLPKVHGFPVRLLVPDIYGMKNVKWVTKIEVVEYDFLGYWQTRGWDDTARMHTTSRADIPRNRSNLAAGENFVGGVAVAGSRGIQQVEVSTDGGDSWAVATIKPGLGPNAWVLWLYRWELPIEDTEQRRILVRAADGTGALQTAEVRDTLPEGSSGYHAVSVRLAEAELRPSRAL
jgi:DMSO/TMAO reductase YedYZ molybdopterin-dependent catalytic subunit